jgi:hypothetical protein
MRNLFCLIAVLFRHQCLVFACFGLIPAQVAMAGDLVQTDKMDRLNRPVVAAQSASTGDIRSGPDGAPANLQLRNTLIIGAGATLVAAYGMHNWWQSGFGGGFDTANEGWFGAGTAYGGADKLGHIYSNYAGVRLLTPLFELAGNSREDAVSLAAWSTLGIYTAVEVVDGYSRRWKFSPQDAIANAAGAFVGVALETHPELDAILDFRVDYRRSPRSPDFDPFGDYSAQKYLLVIKADGFAPLRESRVLRYFEVAIGYGTRGYDNGGVRHRDAYLGLSLNLARLLADGFYQGRMHTTSFQRGTDRLFDLVQFPSIAYKKRSLD